MTTDAIVGMANAGGVADISFDCALALMKLGQQYATDACTGVGRTPWWMRGVLSNVAITGRTFPVNARLLRVDSCLVKYPDGQIVTPGFYGGDDVAVLAAGVGAALLSCGRYNVLYQSGVWTVEFDFTPPVGSTGSVTFAKLLDLAPGKNLDEQIPEFAQFPLISLLKREINRNKFGQDNEKFAIADNEYQTDLARLAQHPTAAVDDRMVFAS